MWKFEENFFSFEFCFWFLNLDKGGDDFKGSKNTNCFCDTKKMDYFIEMLEEKKNIVKKVMMQVKSAYYTENKNCSKKRKKNQKKKMKIFQKKKKFLTTLNFDQIPLVCNGFFSTYLTVHSDRILDYMPS